MRLACDSHPMSCSKWKDSKLTRNCSYIYCIVPWICLIPIKICCGIKTMWVGVYKACLGRNWIILITITNWKQQWTISICMSSLQLPTCWEHAPSGHGQALEKQSVTAPTKYENETVAPLRVSEMARNTARFSSFYVCSCLFFLHKFINVINLDWHQKDIHWIVQPFWESSPNPIPSFLQGRDLSPVSVWAECPETRPGRKFSLWRNMEKR